MNKKTTMGDVKINPGIPSGTASPSSNAVVKFPKKRDPIFANPDVFLTPKEQLERRGYYMEEHIIETKDGYLLTLFRVPYQKGISPGNVDPATLLKADRPVALFSHGIGNNAAAWFHNSDENLIWPELLKLGFDCWFNNARGTKFSKTHKELSNKSRKYWKFSWHEMGDIDIPAIIEHILWTTGQQQIFYFGHSMGCAMLHVAAALHPEIASKIKLMIALAPAVYISNAVTISLTLASKLMPAALFLRIKHGEAIIEPSTTTVQKLHPWASIQNPKHVRKATWVWMKSMELVCGRNREQINWEWMPLFAANSPCSISYKTYEHFLQSFRSNEFQFYDYGRSGNMKKYGVPKPPKYELANSTFPIAIFSGKNDYCCQPKDIQRLGKELPNVVEMFEVRHSKWAHLDFIAAKEAKSYVIPHVMKIVSKYL